MKTVITPEDAEALIHKWIEAVENGMDRSWIAKELGWTTQQVVGRSTSLKRAGVAVPDLKPGIDVKHLNELLGAKQAGAAQVSPF